VSDRVEPNRAGPSTLPSASGFARRPPRPRPRPETFNVDASGRPRLPFVLKVEPARTPAERSISPVERERFRRPPSSREARRDSGRVGRGTPLVGRTARKFRRALTEVRPTSLPVLPAESPVLPEMRDIPPADEPVLPASSPVPPASSPVLQASLPVLPRSRTVRPRASTVRLVVHTDRPAKRNRRHCRRKSGSDGSLVQPGSRPVERESLPGVD
jgi:hypothetical protein